MELFSMLLHGARISARISRCRETFIICMEMSANGPARQVAIFRGHFLGAQSKPPKRRANRLFSENSSFREQNFVLVSAATFEEGINCGAMKALFPPVLSEFSAPGNLRNICDIWGAYCPGIRRQSSKVDSERGKKKEI